MKLGRRSREHFQGGKVVLQDHVSLKWSLKGVIIEGRVSEDGTVRSYVVRKENGRETIRSSRHIKFAARRGETTKQGLLKTLIMKQWIQVMTIQEMSMTQHLMRQLRERAWDQRRSGA